MSSQTLNSSIASHIENTGGRARTLCSFPKFPSLSKNLGIICTLFSNSPTENEMSNRISHLTESHCNRPYGVGYNDRIPICFFHMIFLVCFPTDALKRQLCLTYSKSCGSLLAEQNLMYLEVRFAVGTPRPFK